MGLAQPGDVVYSYANGVLGAVGIVIARASPCPKPTEFGSVGDYWSNEGWLLPVAFTELERAVRPSDANAIRCRPPRRRRRARSR